MEELPYVPPSETEMLHSIIASLTAENQQLRQHEARLQYMAGDYDSMKSYYGHLVETCAGLTRLMEEQREKITLLEAMNAILSASK